MRFLAALLGGKLWLAWLLVAGVGLASLAGAYAWVDHQGYKRAALEWTVKYNAREAELAQQRFKELDRQASANASAKAREAKRLATIERERAELEALLAEFAAAADADENSNRIGLGADSVDRINRVR